MKQQAIKQGESEGGEIPNRQRNETEAVKNSTHQPIHI
jgi:hypothetical protein